LKRSGQEKEKKEREEGRREDNPHLETVTATKKKKRTFALPV
jgi:hypothetical protein